METYAKQTQTDVVQQDRVSDSEGEGEEEAPPTGAHRPESDRLDRLWYSLGRWDVGTLGVLTLYQPMTHRCFMVCHKAMGIYMGG